MCHRTPFRRTRLATLVLAGALSLTVVGIAPRALAAPSVVDIKKAAAEFDLGRKAFEAEEYRRAAQHFEAAHSMAPNAQPLWLALQSRERAGDAPEAATMAALAKALYADNEPVMKDATRVLADAGDELHRVDVACDEACTLVVGLKIVPGAAAKQRVVYLAPGTHSLRASFEGGGEVTETVEAKAGGTSDLEFAKPADIPEPAPTPAEAPEEDPFAKQPSKAEEDEPPAPTSGGISPVFFWTSLGLTAVAGGVTTWSGIDTVENPGTDAVEDACQAGASNCRSLYDQGKDAELRTNVLIGATAGLGVLTVVFAVLTDWSGGGSERGVEGRLRGKGRTVRRRTPSRSMVAAAAGDRGPTVEPIVQLGSGRTFLGARGTF